MDLRTHCFEREIHQGSVMHSTNRSSGHQVHDDTSPFLTMTEVHIAWLCAGANGDVTSMRKLKNQFPEWLGLQRLVDDATSDLISRRPSYSWTGFHLNTIGASALHTSAWNGELDTMRFLLDLGQNPDTPGNDGVTPMMVAILRFTLMTMRCMIRDGEAIKRNLLCDCHEEEREQRRQAIAVIELLLKFGADVNARTQDGKTALHLSTSDDTYEIALVLLDTGAYLDTQDENGKTPLHYCIHENELLVTNLLLERGANIDVEDVKGLTILELVVQRADFNLLQLFFKHHQCVATPQRQDFAGSVLLQAVEVEVENVVRFVVDNGYAPVTVRNEQGENPMHRAILRHNPAMMELLLSLDEGGEIMTAATNALNTPAHYAARYGSIREIETLLQGLISTFGDLQVLQELGTVNPLNEVNKHGMTSLYVASITACDLRDRGATVHSMQARDSKVQLLLDHGALLFAPDVLHQEFADVNANNLHLRFPVQIQHCLRMWLRDVRVHDNDKYQDADSQIEAFANFCLRWIAYLASDGCSLTVVSIVACAGYGHELLPMLVELPIRRRDMSQWLHQFKKYATYDCGHVLLLELHAEMRTAWNGQSFV